MTYNRADDTIAEVERCEKGHKRRRDECSGCQNFTTIQEM